MIELLFGNCVEGLAKTMIEELKQTISMLKITMSLNKTEATELKH